jgi:hypothetical protein
MHLSNDSLDNEHRQYLAIVLVFTFTFDTFPSILYQYIDEQRDKQQMIHVRRKTNLESCHFYLLFCLA